MFARSAGGDGVLDQGLAAEGEQQQQGNDEEGEEDNLPADRAVFALGFVPYFFVRHLGAGAEPVAIAKPEGAEGAMFR